VVVVGPGGDSLRYVSFDTHISFMGCQC
jgi:hypothetical protein